MGTISDTLEPPPSPLSSLGGEARGAPSTTTLWIPRTLAYTNPHATSPSCPIGTNPFEFTWSLDHTLNFSSRQQGTGHHNVPLATSPFTFGMPNFLARIPSSIHVHICNISVEMSCTYAP